MDYEIGLLEIDLLLQRQEPESALKIVNAHIKRLKSTAGAGLSRTMLVSRCVGADG